MHVRLVSALASLFMLHKQVRVCSHVHICPWYMFLHQLHDSNRGELLEQQLLGGLLPPVHAIHTGVSWDRPEHRDGGFL